MEKVRQIFNKKMRMNKAKNILFAIFVKTSRKFDFKDFHAQIVCKTILLAILYSYMIA